MKKQNDLKLKKVDKEQEMFAPIDACSSALNHSIWMHPCMKNVEERGRVAQAALATDFFNFLVNRRGAGAVGAEDAPFS